MPSSHLHQLNELMETIRLVNPDRILDVGVGFGKYGFLAREYLDVRHGRLQPEMWERRIDGIEVFEGYLSPLHHMIYNHIYVADVGDVLPALEIRYDLVLLIDVLEHFERKAGLHLLHQLRGVADNILVSTPKTFIQQAAMNGNPYEEHHSLWQPPAFRQFGPHCFIPNDISHICLIGQAASRVHAEFYTLRRRLKRTFPLLVAIYGGAKRTIGGF